MSPDRLLLDQLLEAMFPRDPRGRMTGAAPWLHILRTTDEAICRCHADMPDATAVQIQAMAAAPRGRPGAWAEEYARYLAQTTSIATVTAVRAGPLFRFPDKLPEGSECVPIHVGNLDLLKGALDEWVWDAETGAPMMAALADGRAVSVCASVRISGAAHCAGVETAAAYRGRGLAEHAVAGWARLVRERGAEPFYATTFDNLASQKVARRLGLNLIGSEFSIYAAALQPEDR